MHAELPPSPEPEAARGLDPPAERQEFAAIYREQARFVWRSLGQLGVRPADIEDACQEVFLVAHRKLEEFDWSRSLRAWLFGIAMRVAAAHRRRAHRRYEQAEAEPDAVTRAPQEGEVARRQAAERLERILDTLGEAQRAVFILYELQELPMNEVATIVECPLQTAYSRLHAARKLVTAAIAASGGAP